MLTCKDLSLELLICTLCAGVGMPRMRLRIELSGGYVLAKMRKIASNVAYIF